MMQYFSTRLEGWVRKLTGFDWSQPVEGVPKNVESYSLERFFREFREKRQLNESVRVLFID